LNLLKIGAGRANMAFWVEEYLIFEIYVVDAGIKALVFGISGSY
jgi:hypothetical protein